MPTLGFNSFTSKAELGPTGAGREGSDKRPASRRALLQQSETQQLRQHHTQSTERPSKSSDTASTAKRITTPGKQSNTEMEDTCENRAGLLQRESKAPADVLFISTLITGCCETVKEKLAGSHPQEQTSVAQVLRHRTTRTHLAGKGMG